MAGQYVENIADLRSEHVLGALPYHSIENYCCQMY